ncbi:MAG: ABC transporter ATP-binding protein [Bacilli bacterium]|nr:ABC transporter ATP-binding protein [Bacilli bacterium]
MQSMKKLVVKNLVKEFKLSRKQMMSQKTTNSKLVAVNDLSFELTPGVIYGLLGPNGAGKTTTLRMIASLIKPKSGSIYYDDKDINSNICEYRSKIGFLTSELKLDEFFTADDTFNYMGKLYGMTDEQISKKKEELFASFGINRFKNVKIKELSTGMKQKVSLAVSLCHDPEIIIFDEPTNGLDVMAAREVENFLINLKDENHIILISTHIFSLVEKLCDRVGIVMKGRMILDESMEEIHKKGSVEDVFFDLADKEDMK